MGAGKRLKADREAGGTRPFLTGALGRHHSLTEGPETEALSAEVWTVVYFTLTSPGSLRDNKMRIIRVEAATTTFHSKHKHRPPHCAMPL